MTDEELQAIEDRAIKASKGPWVLTLNTKFGPAVWSGDDILFRSEAGLKHSKVSEADPVPQWRKDMSFVRAAREDVPALIAELRSSRASLARLVEWREAQLAVERALRGYNRAANGDATGNPQAVREAMAELRRCGKASKAAHDALREAVDEYVAATRPEGQEVGSA